MADQLTAYLIEMAKDEEALARYLKNPRAEARKAGVPEEQISILTEGDPRKIFEYVNQSMNQAQQRGFEIILVIFKAPSPQRSAVKRSGRKTSSARRPRGSNTAARRRR
jgi:hypothetical protein